MKTRKIIIVLFVALSGVAFGQSSGFSWSPGIQLHPAGIGGSLAPYPNVGTVKYGYELNGGLNLIDTEAPNHEGKVRLGWGMRVVQQRHLNRHITGDWGLGWQRSNASFVLNDTTYKVRSDWFEIPLGLSVHWRQIGYLTPYLQTQFIPSFQLTEEFRREVTETLDVILSDEAWSNVRVDFRLAAGCSYELGPKWSTFAQIQWRRSVTNIVHDESILNIEDQSNFYFAQVNLAVGLTFNP